MSIKAELEEVRRGIRECEEYLSKVRELEDKLVRLKYRLVYLEAPVFNEYGHYGENNKALDGWEKYIKESI